MTVALAPQRGPATSRGIPLADIRTDGGTQTRACVDDAAIAAYADDLAAGATFPPVVVYHDGADFWLADGFHRVAAARRLGWTEILADVQLGSRRDATLHAAGANATHGLRRTNADKQRAVELLLADPEWSKWSNREIARCVGVSHPFVGRLRGGNGYHPDRFGRYAAHPVLTAIPAFEGVGFEELVRSIGANGQALPCVVWGDWLVDGRARWRACELLGIAPMIVERDFADELDCAEYIVAMNVKRAHYAEGQRANLAATALSEESAGSAGREARR